MLERCVSVADATVNYGGSTIIDSDFRFNVKKAEVVAIVGKSGCGKSTLLRLIVGALGAHSGVVTKPVSCAYMPQADGLLRWRNTRENAALLAECESEARNNYNIDAALAAVGLDPFVEKFPHELSGGMARRVAFVRTIVLSRELYVLDEPTISLDFETQLMVEALLRRRLASQSSAAVIVTHDVDSAVAVADRVIVVAGSPLRTIGEVDGSNDVGASVLEVRQSPRFTKGYRDVISLMRAA